MKKIDEAGNYYGNWEVIREATTEETNGRKGGIYWLCRCKCKDRTEKIICGTSLRNGESTSCGCHSFKRISKPSREFRLKERIFEEKENYQGYKMKIIKYFSANDMIVEFSDTYKGKVHCSYKSFCCGSVKNPYHPDVYNVGMIGSKYKAFENGKEVKEYKTWHGILQRGYDEKLKNKQPTYVNCVVSEAWKLYENFYEWIHMQDNYYKWSTGSRWVIDKDIIKKWNKIYSSDYCILIPENVNTLFTRRQNDRGEYPIGVYYYKKGDCFRAQCMNPLLNKRILIGSFNDPCVAFFAYKEYKERLIKEIAELEYKQKNITERCYDAMINYEVEITD